MVYGIIYLIPQQVRVFIDKQSLYITILSLGISTLTGMFSVVFWLTIATDVRTQEEVVKITCHLFFCPNKRLDTHEASVILYFIEQGN